MDKLAHYRICIQTLLEQHSQSKTQDDEVADELVFDRDREHYQLMSVGWNGLKLKQALMQGGMMIDPNVLEQLKTASVGDRIAVIEMLVQSLKGDIRPGTDTLVEATAESQRPAFGFMKHTGAILGDVITPVLPEHDWEVLQ